MTTAYRILGYLPLLAAIHIEDRAKLILIKEHNPTIYTYPFANFEDLKEALYLTQYASGVRPCILEWYDNLFLVSINEKKVPDWKLDSRKDTIFEDIIAITVKQLSDATKKIQGKRLTTRQIIRGYLEPLMNNGYVDNQTSNLNKSQNIYYPLINLSRDGEIEREKVGHSETFEDVSLLSQHSQIIVQNSALYPSKQYIKLQIEGMLEAVARSGIKEKEKNIIDIDRVIEKQYRITQKSISTSTD